MLILQSQITRNFVTQLNVHLKPCIVYIIRYDIIRLINYIYINVTLFHYDLFSIFFVFFYSLFTGDLLQKSELTTTNFTA